MFCELVSMEYLIPCVFAVVCLALAWLGKMKYGIDNSIGILQFKEYFNSCARINYNSYNEEECLLKRAGTIRSLEQMAETVTDCLNVQHRYCRELQRAFQRMFKVKSDRVHVVVPETFAAKLKQWFQHQPHLISQFSQQTIISVLNIWTHQNSVFNMLRDKRVLCTNMPAEKQLVQSLIHQSEVGCDFCPEHYLTRTLPDELGRIETKHSYTCNNAFRVCKHHSMVMFRNHHPIDWTKEEYMDVCHTALTKIDHFQNYWPGYEYAVLLWDQFFRSGASQIHPHIHVLLADNNNMGEFGLWLNAAQQYNSRYRGSDYFRDLLLIHNKLGLTVEFGTAVAFASLTPRKDHEVVVVGNVADDDFFLLLYIVVRTFLDNLHMFSFSAAACLPLTREGTFAAALPLLRYASLGRTVRMPAIARIVTRGSLQENRSDISSLELFTTSNVNVDPYRTIQAVRQTLDEHTHPSNQATAGATANQGYQLNNQRYQTGNQGYQTSNQSYQSNNQGYPSTSQGYQTSNQGYNSVNQNYQPGTQGYKSGTQGHQSTTQGHQAGKHGHKDRKHSYQSPTQGYQSAYPNVRNPFKK